MPHTPMGAPDSAPHTSRILADIITERFRQILGEGWTTDHDDEHTGGELASAAACYAMPPDLEDRSVINVDRPNVACPPDLWPWGPEAWKPTTRRRDLVKAAALLLAELERLDRAETPKPGRYRDTDGALGTLSEVDAFANRYTFTPDGHRPPAVLPDPQPAHLRDRHLGPDAVRRLVPVPGPVVDLGLTLVPTLNLADLPEEDGWDHKALREAALAIAMARPQGWRPVAHDTGGGVVFHWESVDHRGEPTGELSESLEPLLPVDWWPSTADTFSRGGLERLGFAWV